MRGGGSRVLRKKRGWRDNYEGPIRSAVEFGLCRDGKKATDNSVREFGEKMPFGCCVFPGRQYE